MASFELIYVQAARGGEERRLAELRPIVSNLYGKYHARIKRRSGWVQLQSMADEDDQAIDLLDLFKMLHQPGMFAPSDQENARTISEQLPMDVVYVQAVTSVDAVQFTRLRRGQATRNFTYSWQDEAQQGWPSDDGKPEPWERQWHNPRTAHGGPSITDVGKALGLPGLEADYVDGYSFDIQLTISGRRWKRPKLRATKPAHQATKARRKATKGSKVAKTSKATKNGGKASKAIKASKAAKASKVSRRSKTPKPRKSRSE